MANGRGMLWLGFWVRGFRYFPWMAVNFFLKDGLNVDPSTHQLLLSCTNIPILGKPFYGIFSDVVYIFGQHRVPYITIGAFLQAVSWLNIAFLPLPSISIFSISLFLGNLGASIADVANDATVAEIGRQPTASENSRSSSSSELQSLLWIASSAGCVIGNLLGGVTISRLSPQAMFFIFGLVLALQFVITIRIRESSLNLRRRSSSNFEIRRQFSQLSVALKKPEIAKSIGWLAASYAAIPALTGTMFFYRTQYLEIDSTVLGMSKVFGQAAMLLWSIIYKRYFTLVPARKLIAGIQAMTALLVVSDVLFVKGAYRNMGVPDSFYVVVFSGILEFLPLSKILPFNVLIAQLCPQGCEGSLMAFVTFAMDFSRMVSGYLGVALASCVGITGNDFSGFPCGLLIQALCTLFPVLLSSCIPDERISEARRRG